ncbi:MAG: hypothetical protein DMG65_09320 [Candidatus Angelobacter sp. Gp1-AA117]|nr:MAG: hypothetical protein DMG65_09320 [Candidatus Angelobacter sp. Gp1-AA117]
MSALFSIKAEIESQLSPRFPAAFGVKERPEFSLLPTGIAALDHFCGGVPCGALTEICAHPAHSSGICSLLMSLLKTTSADHFCAFIDGSDAFNVRWADALQVQLEHLLWVRCQDRSPDKPLPGRLDQALKATDLLLKANCGFNLVLLDLQDMPEKLVRRVPLDVWYRFRQTVEQLKAALVITTPAPVTGACSALVLRLQGAGAKWESTTNPPQRHGDTKEPKRSGDLVIGGSGDRVIRPSDSVERSLQEEHTHNTTLEEFCIDVEVNRRRDFQKRSAVARLQFTASRSL